MIRRGIEGFLEEVRLQLDLERLGRWGGIKGGHGKHRNHHKQRHRVKKMNKEQGNIITGILLR